MDENKKASLTILYNKYQVVDWIIAFAVIAALIFGVPNVPTALIAVIFIAGFIYTVWTIWLYVKVWPIIEIRNKGVYWFDWTLTIGLTLFEAYILFIVLTGAEPFWVRILSTLLYH